MERGYNYLIAFFILILILVPIGFRDYFTSFPSFENFTTATHIHAFLMSLWCIALIAQPIFIKSRRLDLHRKVGKFSYVLAPLIVISMIIMINHSFEGIKASDGLEAAWSHSFFLVTQVFLFALFYVLAIFNRKKPASHMRCMIVSSVTFLGPTIGRINFDVPGINMTDLDLYTMDTVLIFFILLDGYCRKVTWPYILGMALFLSAHISIILFSSSQCWYDVAGMFLN